MAGKGLRGLIDFLVGQGRDADTAALGAVGDLPMSQAQQRMLEQNYTPNWYHASTHDVKDFRGDVTNIENDMGQGIYLTNTIEDANANYAGIGGDLKNRIESEAELIESAAHYDSDKALQKQMAEISGKKFGSMDYDERMDAARQIASGKLVGDAEAVTYPMALDLEDFAQIGGKNPTMVGDKATDYLAEAKKDIKRKDFETDEDYEDALYEFSDQLRYDDVDSPEMVLRDTMADYGVNVDEMPPIELYEDTPIREVYDTLKSVYLEDRITGQPIPAGGVFTDWLERIGYKGLLDHTVDEKFGTQSGRMDGGMKGMNPDTVHAIVFPKHEGVMRSQYGAAFDESKKGQKGILNQLAPIAVPTAAASTLGATMFKPSEALASPDAPTKANAASLYNPYRAAKIEAEQLRAKQRDPLGFDLTDVKRDPNAGTDILGAIGAGIERSIHSLPHLLTPEGTAQFVGGALGAPSAFELMDKQIQQKAPDYQPEGEMTDKERTLWQLLGEMASPY